MKFNLLTRLATVTLLALISCSEVKPRENAATILTADLTECGACGGWFVQVDENKFRAELPEAYKVVNKPVWVRFKKDESTGLKVSGNWIVIMSIRDRM